MIKVPTVGLAVYQWETTMRLAGVVGAIALAAVVQVFALSAHGETIAVPENQGPWGFNAAAPVGQQGVYADLANALSRRLDMSVKVEFVPYGRMLEGVRTGQFDYSFAVVSPALAEAGPFITMVAKIPMIAVARKGLKLASLDDLHSFESVGLLRGGSCGKAVDSDPAIHLASQDNYEVAIRKLAAGRLDGWCSSKAGFDYALGNLHMADQMGNKFEYGEVNIGLQASHAKAGTPEADRMAHAVADLVAEETAGRVFMQYLGKTYSP